MGIKKISQLCECMWKALDFFDANPHGLAQAGSVKGWEILIGWAVNL